MIGKREQAINSKAKKLRLYKMGRTVGKSSGAGGVVFVRKPNSAELSFALILKQ
jgi:hypothetical protein